MQNHSIIVIIICQKKKGKSQSNQLMKITKHQTEYLANI